MRKNKSSVASVCGVILSGRDNQNFSWVVCARSKGFPKYLPQLLLRFTILLFLTGFSPSVFAGNYVPGTCSHRKDNPTDACVAIIGEGSLAYPTYQDQWKNQHFDCSNPHPGCSYPNTNLYDPRGPWYCWTANQLGINVSCQIAACPDHASGSPCVCDAGYEFDSTGTSCVPNTLTITFSGGTTTEPGKDLSLTVTVENQDHQPPKSPVPVKISLKVDPTTGGHDHGDATRPRGDIDNIKCETDDTCKTLSIGSEGSATITFKAPAASGIHTVTATCDQCSNGPQKAEIKVMVEGLEPIPTSIHFNKISPNADTNHPHANYLSTEAIARLRDIGLQYGVMGLLEFGVILPPLQINDASLMWGGVLDCFLTCKDSKPWGPSHEEHRKGTVVDIRANGGIGSIPISKKMTSRFSLLVGEYISTKYPDSKGKLKIAGLHGKGDFRHFHVRLLGRKE